MYGRKVEQLAYMMLLALAAMLAGCGTSRNSQHLGGQVYSPSGGSAGRTAPTTVTLPPKASPSMAALLTEANSWIGTPYKYGGNTREGVDCSGFVLQVYLRALDISLPRTSAQQQDFCRKIRRDELKPGDLMFFSVREGGNVGHVGIYIGDGMMIHASSKVGVVVAPLNTSYFERNYLSSGRIEAYGKLLASEARPATQAPAPAVKPQAAPPAPAPTPAPKAQPPAPQPQSTSPVPAPPARQPIKTVRIAPSTPASVPEIDNDFFD